MAQWVQHKSGVGEKWEVYADGIFEVDWKVKAKRSTGRLAGCHYLPKSEYIPCEPPEQWEEVAVTLSQHADNPEIYVASSANGEKVCDVDFYSSGYRVKSLVVERRKA